MTSLSDTLTVGLVLVLLFGSIALYLYTRIQQAEQKINLLETILLDLKMSAEIKSYTDLPAPEPTPHTQEEHREYAPFYDVEQTSDNDDEEVVPGGIVRNEKHNSPASSVASKNDMEVESDIEQYRNVLAEAVQQEVVSESTPVVEKVSANYESMTLKELQALAKSRGILGVTQMKKGPIIEALKTSDRTQTVEPGSTGTDGSSFLETSGAFLSKVSE